MATVTRERVRTDDLAAAVMDLVASIPDDVLNGLEDEEDLGAALATVARFWARGRGLDGEELAAALEEAWPWLR